MVQAQASQLKHCGTLGLQYGSWKSGATEDAVLCTYPCSSSRVSELAGEGLARTMNIESV